MSLLNNSREILFQKFVKSNFSEKEKKHPDIRNLSLKKLLYLQQKNELQEDFINLFFKSIKKKQKTKEILKNILQILKKKKLKNLIFYQINSSNKKLSSLYRANSCKLPIKINLDKKKLALLRKIEIDSQEIKKVILEDSLKEWDLYLIKQIRHKGLLLLQFPEKNDYTEVITSLLCQFFNYIDFSSLNE